MNNAFLTIEDALNEEKSKDPTPQLRERTQQLTDIIEALQSIGASSHWKVLHKYIFEMDLDKAKRSLAKSEDTTERFRLQGDIRTGEKLNLETLITKYRNELTTIRQKLHE